jgi:hypothetical protein
MSQATAKTTVLLTPEQVAGDLGIGEVEVLRLIAKRRLPAAMIPTPGDGPRFRIMAGALEKYVADGCQDCRCPDFADGWYASGSIASLAGQFQGAMLGAIEQQAPPLEQIQADFSSGRMLVYTVKTTGAVASLVDAPAPTSAFAPRGSGQPSFRDWKWWQTYAVSLIRDEASAILSSLPGMFSGQPMRSLFSGGPDEFDVITTAAYFQASKRFVSTSVSGQSVAGATSPQWVSLCIRWPVAEILTPSRKSSLLNFAF